jgi:arsenate reductase
MKKIMFLCTANSCRSQMAEGFAKEICKGVMEVYSAGLMSAFVHKKAIAVMKELGIDISEQKSKAIDEFLLREMDFVVTLCNKAEDLCPSTPPGTRKIYRPIKDPVGMLGTEEEIMNNFRRARDEIRELIEKLYDDLSH